MAKAKTELPRALAPWSEELGLFPLDLATALGRWVPRLAALLGPARPLPDAQNGEPDGFNGITRRGTPDLLLSSEWLLASEEPDEFLRRAVMSEQFFLRRSLSLPHGSQRSLLLFDAGPDQVGAPRLAHLALLIVLARRAAAAKRDFEWAVIQDPTDTVGRGFTPDEVRRLLRVRSAHPVTAERFSRWTEVLAYPTPGDEIFVVTTDLSLIRHCEKAATIIAVSEPFDPGACELRVSVDAPNRPPRGTTLSLPVPDVGVRILRNPFEAPSSPATHAERAIGHVCFSAREDRFCIRSHDGELLYWHVSQAAERRGTPAGRFPRQEGFQILAAGWIQRRKRIVLDTDGTITRLHGLGDEHTSSGHRATTLEPSPDGVTPRPHDSRLSGVFTCGSNAAIAFMDAAGRLFRVHVPNRQVEYVRDSVLAVAPVQGALQFVAQDPGGLVLQSLGPVNAPKTLVHIPLPDGVFEVKVGAGMRLAIRTKTTDLWHVHGAPTGSPGTYSPVLVPENYEVIGPAQPLRSERGTRSAIWALDETRTQIMLVQAVGRPVSLARLPAPATGFGLGLTQGHLAVVTARSDIHVLGPDGRQVLRLHRSDGDG